MTHLDARFRVLCLLLAGQLEGRYHANSCHGWDIIWTARTLQTCAVLGYHREIFECSECGYNNLYNELQRLGFSTYPEHANAARELLLLIDQFNANPVLPHLDYLSLTEEEKARYILRLQTDRQYRMLQDWETAFLAMNAKMETPENFTECFT